jgi:hypothetical protein
MSVEVKNLTIIDELVRSRGGSMSFELPNGRFIVDINSLRVKSDGTLVISNKYLEDALKNENLSIDELAHNVNCNC